MTTYTFYCTFGSGQANYPGYFRVTVEADNLQAARNAAYRRMNEATGGRWCGLYDDLEAMNEGDRVFRGEI